jgi:NAD(P)-dependent dehydrogenase (short-subunit alcohol dehydrogenase family)
MALSNKRVVVVTGATRGAGRGIALGLAPDATVYVTGRSQKEGDGPEGLGGTVFATAAEVDARGGRGIPVVCDHGDDEQVRALFAQVEHDEGRIDILVNNAFALPPKLPGKAGFWEQPLSQLDTLAVGLRSNYVAAYYAAPMMAAQREGLIVFTSAPAGRVYTLGPTFGAAHAGADKMAHDMAIELEPFNVAVLAIWMGLLRTERALRAIKSDPDGIGKHFDNAETPEFTGLIIDALAKDPKLLERSGKVWWGAELGEEYGVADTDGRQPPSNRGWIGPTTEYSDLVL